MHFALWFFSFLFGAVLALAGMRPAEANDSMAEMAVGGLTLVESQDITLDSEDLYISENEVRVNYKFTNTSDHDVTALVAFPLPEQKAEEIEEMYVRDITRDLAFKTVIDGEEQPYDTVNQAIWKGKDISARITGLGLPFFNSDESFDPKVKALKEEDRKALLDEGLIVNFGTDAEPSYVAAWNMRINITRTQVFPAGKTISVEHSYKPLVGGSVGGRLKPEYLKEDWMQADIKKYCMDDTFLGSVQKQVKKRGTEQNPDPYSEIWLGYVLKSGANWKGPIKDFRLVVDKGAPENLVSLCADGVKKIAPTQFEVRKSNYEPGQDIYIDIVKWVNMQQ